MQGRNDVQADFEEDVAHVYIKKLNDEAPLVSMIAYENVFEGWHTDRLPWLAAVLDE